VKLLKNKTSTVKDKRLQHEEFAKTKTSKSITHVCPTSQRKQKYHDKRRSATRFGTRGAFQITMHAKSANVRNTRGKQ